MIVRHRCRIFCTFWQIALVFLCLCNTQLSAQNRPIDRAIENWVNLLGVNEEGEATTEDRRETGDEPEADPTPLGMNLAAIHLLSQQEQATMSPSVGAERIVIDDEIPAPEALSAELEVYLGKPVSMALLSELSKTIVNAWRESEYPLVDVYFPEQNITEGKVQIVVREATLGEKRANGLVFSDEQYIVGQVRLEPGDRINARVLEGDIDWLNENPFRQVNLVYERGEADATSDIVLEVSEDKQLRAYAGFANTGLTTTGENEFSFGATLGNPFKKEQIVGYNYTTDDQWKHLKAHSAFYQGFLPWRHTFGLLGAYVESDARQLGALGISGVSQQITARYEVPLGRPDFNRRWKHRCFLAFDYKGTDTDLLFGGANFFGTEIAIGQFRGGYEFSVPDDFGFTRVTAELILSPGNMYGNNNDGSFGTARVGSKADYFYAKARAERFFNLPAGFKLNLELTGQVTDARLASTEQILGGGYNTVRGFDESVIRGDSGIIGSVELAAPPLDLCDRLQDQWTPFAFFDAAGFRVNDALPGEASPSLSSAGLGLNCQLGEIGYARASYGWALSASGVSPALLTNGKFHFGVTLSY